MKDKIVSLNVNLKDLDGKEVQGTNLGKLVAGLLVSQPKGDVLKFYDWALKFNKGEVVTVDRSDYEKLKAFITDHEGLNIIAKAQILPLLENDKPLEEPK